LRDTLRHNAANNYSNAQKVARMETATATHLEVITKFVATREKHPKAAMFALQAVARELLGDSRLRICYRHKIPDRHVEIWHSQERKTAYYCGLMKCGMQWVCPLCSARLSEKRRAILRAALDNSRDRFVPVLVSYTVQHDPGDRLADLLAGMLAAYRRMRQSRFWRDLKEEYMIRGECRALEITHGDNGWHPHFHVLMMLDIGILAYLKVSDTTYDLERLYQSLTQQLTSEWIAHLEHFHLAAQRGPGLHVRGDWSTLDDYLTKSGTAMPAQAEKWGVAEEMTKSQRKHAQLGGVNVWDMLLLHYAGFRPYGQLFLEYYAATKGRSMLQWTPGMLAQLQVPDQTDQEMLDADPDPGDLLLIRLSEETWRQVLDRAAEGALLDAASTGEWDRVIDFLRTAGIDTPE